MADISITAASVLKSANGQPIPATCGQAITAGQAIYVDTGNVLKLSDANGAAAARTCAGIALNGGATGQPASYVRSDAAFVLGGTGTSGLPAFVSETPGGITMTPADVTTGSTGILLGIFNTDGTLNLSPVVGGVK